MWWDRKWISGYFLTERTAGWNEDAQPTSWMSYLPNNKRQAVWSTVSMQTTAPTQPWPPPPAPRPPPHPTPPPGERKEALPCDYNAVTIIHCNFTRRVLGQLASRLQEIYLKPRACWSQGPFLWPQGQTQEDRQNGVWAFSTVIEFKVVPTH